MSEPTKVIVFWTTILSIVIAVVLYSAIGTRGNVQEIRRLAPAFIKKSGWRILRGEGYQYGSWSEHGGKVWYHVQDTLNPDIRYRVYITMWDGELMSSYGAPEVLERVQVNVTK